MSVFRIFRKKYRVKYGMGRDRKFFFYSSALRFARKKYRAKITRIKEIDR